MKSDYIQEIQNNDIQEKEFEISFQKNSDKKMQKLALIKQLKINRSQDNQNSSSNSNSDMSDPESPDKNDLDQISLVTVKDLYENSGDGMIDQEVLVAKKKKKKLV
jgi:hypothetical protein